MFSPETKYKQYTPLDAPDRQWPSRVPSKHPIWLSTDLRDGNQAIPTPMTITQKLTLFHELVRRGFKEIEIAYPSASDTEFGFVRKLIDEDLIPDDVWIQVMAPMRRENIERTFLATRGAKKVMLHMYHALAPIFREVVYQSPAGKLVDIAVEYTHLARQLAERYRNENGTSFRLIYGMEGFSQCELDLSVHVCSLVKTAWDPYGPNSLLFNLCSTVECAPANHFADQVEYFCKTLPARDQVLISVHIHNDRGTAVAATEHAILAGADRVEGCIFGNGERTGNVDLITLALNLYTQGISPELDLKNLGDLVELATELTGIPVHPRQPYSGSLVYTAFSGAHQDGIKKGLDRMTKDHREIWEVPYVPVDPTDLGFAYEARVNSQSGKGGCVYIVEDRLKIKIPREVQIQFAAIIKHLSDKEAREMSPDEMCNIFKRTFPNFQRKEKFERPAAIRMNSSQRILGY